MRTSKRKWTIFAVVGAMCLGAQVFGATPADAGHVSLSIGFHVPVWGPSFWWGPSWYWPAYYAPRFYSVPREVVLGASRGQRDIGAISLKVRPKKTEVWVDGNYAGRSGKFDGYPGYLWLEKGTHELVFYREGFRTFSGLFEVRAGMVNEVAFIMERGEATPPEDAMTPVRGREEGTPPARPPLQRQSSSEAGSVASRPLDLRSEGGRIRVLVEPREASVYLDGRFLGTGAELERLQDGLRVDVGEHVLEAVHPRFAADRVTFRSREGESVEVRLALKAPEAVDGTQ